MVSQAKAPRLTTKLLKSGTDSSKMATARWYHNALNETFTAQETGKKEDEAARAHYLKNRYFFSLSFFSFSFLCGFPPAGGVGLGYLVDPFDPRFMFAISASGGAGGLRCDVGTGFFFG